MIEIKSKLRKWGNSFGIVVPKKAVKKENFNEGDEVSILIGGKKHNVLKEMFGTFKFDQPVEKIMKEINKELYND